jgi:uncharacterized protein (TIGR02421 family)
LHIVSQLTPELQHFAELDAELVAAVRDIKLLSVLSWPMSVQTQFVSDWQRRKIRLPEISYKRFDYSERRATLASIIERADSAHPVGNYIARTAQSWVFATLLLEHAGTAQMGEYSIQLFGKPGDTIAGSEVHNIDAARHFIVAAREIMHSSQLAEPDYCLSAETMREEIQNELDRFFTNHKIRVTVDEELVAKAAAGPTRIRLRARTSFTEYDRMQLLQHEAFVHSLTALNGREQPYLKSLGFNSPRITATQEGLAVFAELVTGSIDLGRMNRISQRIIGIDLALKGADFIDVFRFFLDEGQSESESFTSAMRVFRGAPLSGGSAFTKDTVYLHGLLSVHTFFRWVFKQNRLILTRHLFAGKMTLQDVLALEPFYESGFLTAPLYLPTWAQRSNALAGYLSFSLFANKIRLDQIERDDLRLGV